MKYLHPDLHMHSTASDGTDSPEELIQKVKEAGVDIFALTDHDSYLGCDIIRSALKEGDPKFIYGIELSCTDDLGKYHILGYNYNVNKPSIQNAADFMHNERRKKVANRFIYMEAYNNMTFTDEEKAEILKYENPGKPHIAELMVKRGYATDIKAAIKILNTYHGEEKKLTPEAAIDAIQKADGIPVLAHGILGDGDQKFTYEEMDERVKRLKSYGLMGLECYYSTYTQEQNEIMLSLAEKYNLMVTAGSDCHGKKKTIKYGDTGYFEIDPKKMERFYRMVELLMQVN